MFIILYILSIVTQEQNISLKTFVNINNPNGNIVKYLIYLDKIGFSFFCYELTKFYVPVSYVNRPYNIHTM